MQIHTYLMYAVTVAFVNLEYSTYVCTCAYTVVVSTKASICFNYIDTISQADISTAVSTQEDSTPAVFSALPSDHLSTNGTFCYT